MPAHGSDRRHSGESGCLSVAARAFAREGVLMRYEVVGGQPAAGAAPPAAQSPRRLPVTFVLIV